MDLVFEAYLLPSDAADFPLVDSPVWIFGRSYSIHYDIDELRRSVATCMWISYRKNFPTIGDTHMTSDRGWGCMIRCGQMLIAKTLILRHLGKLWHWHSGTRDEMYLRLASYFADTRTASLSLHQIASNGAILGKPVGSWLGPNTVMQAIKRIVLVESVLDLHVHIAMDSILVISEVKESCVDKLHGRGQERILSKRVDPRWKPLLLVVPLRLGLSELNPAYIPGLKGVFESPQNVGIMGGRPNHALFFIGYAENELLYLDPHTVQSAVSIGSKCNQAEEAADETYHVQKPGRMNFLAMDPSVAVCFYLNTEEELDTLCKKLGEKFSSSLGLFEICEKRASFSNSSSSAPTVIHSSEHDEEGFEML